ncbi:hypothetical protein Trydic_g5327 [Trypoxylus dichotomus]
MAIVPENYPESSISQELAELFRNCILKELDKLNVGGSEPKVSEVRHRAGMLRAACVPLVWIPGPQMESDQILHRLKVQNQKLPMSSWRMVGTKADPKGQQMVVAMDEGSWKVLQDTYHDRLHLKFSSVSFRLLGRKTKEQEEAQERMDTTVAGPSNLSTPEPGGGNGTGSPVDSPLSFETAHTITDLLESQMDSTGTNKRGESLINHFVTNGLVTLNRGNKPTFVTVSRAEVIDVTVCRPRFARWVKQWHVSDEPSLSDHRYIRFDIELPQVSKMSYRNPRNCNWDAYRERLIEKLERCSRRIKTAVDIELLAESLQSAIITSYEASCPVKIRSTNRDTPWWTRELSELRTTTRKLYNKCKNLVHGTNTKRL